MNMNVLSKAYPGVDEVETRCELELVHAVCSLAQSTDVTVAVVVQAMFALVLSRYNAEESVVFGQIGGDQLDVDRTELSRAGDHGPAPFFSGVRPVRVDLNDRHTIRELLSSLKEQSRSRCPHEETSRLQWESAQADTTAPRFEALLMFLDGELEGAIGTAVSDVSSVPLILNVVHGVELTLRAFFDPAKFTQGAVRRLVESFRHTLGELAKDADAQLGDIDVLPPAERHRIVVEWNETARPFSKELCIHELFEAQAALQPDLPAVEVEGKVTSYSELDARANRLAHVLIHRGVQPGNCVGICLPRGLDLVTAMLGVLKAGAAYLPIDPDYPPDRIQFMFQDAGTTVIICDRTTARHITDQRLVLDVTESAAFARASELRPERQLSAVAQCYTIYTSGSTGQPKGVVLTHRAVVNTLEWVNRTFQVATGDRLLFVTSPCFDLSVYDVFGTLGAGGTVVVASERQLAEPETLADLLVDTKITIWNSAPATLQRLAPFIARKGGALLRLCLLSGDWIPLKLPDLVRSAFPSCQVVSLGGATEAAIWSNWYPIDRIDERWTSIPYGRPIQNAQYYVLDRRLQPVPVGVSGDLYIAGVCLASGYHGRQQLTKERFFPAPFAEAQGATLYKTGDLARYFEDGNLEFLGRSDFQVKIRGFRVEMGEVETALCQLDGVEAAVCVAQPDASGQKALIGWVVARPGHSAHEESIKAQLAARLPAFMVPSRILFLEALPTTSNGKVDRAALAHARPSVSAQGVIPPRGAVEAELVRLWCDLLQRDQVCVTDNFFEIGGHSLLAVMLVARIKHRFGLDLPLTTIIAHPTIRAISPQIEGATGVHGVSQHLQVFHRSGHLPPLVLVPGLIGTAFTYHLLSQTLGAEQPIYVVDLLASGSEAAFPTTIEEMADLYEPEVLKICEGGPIVLGGFSFGARVAFELVRRLRRRGREIPLFISFDGFAPGYPQPLSPLARVVSHVREVLSRDNAGRLEYLRERKTKIRNKVLTRLGVEPKQPAIKSEFQLHMDRLSAVQRRAGLLYAPQGVQSDLALLLIKAEECPPWSGTKMNDPLYGWQRFISGPTSVVTFPGGHMDIWSDGNRAPMTQAIADHLARFVGPGIQ